MEREQHKVV